MNLSAGTDEGIALMVADCELVVAAAAAAKLACFTCLLCSADMCTDPIGAALTFAFLSMDLVRLKQATGFSPSNSGATGSVHAAEVRSARKGEKGFHTLTCQDCERQPAGTGKHGQPPAPAPISLSMNMQMLKIHHEHAASPSC